MHIWFLWCACHTDMQLATISSRLALLIFRSKYSFMFFFVFLSPPSREAQLVGFLYQGSISSGAFLIMSGLTLARIQSTTGLEMISHRFTAHELRDLFVCYSPHPLRSPSTWYGHFLSPFRPTSPDLASEALTSTWLSEEMSNVMFFTLFLRADLQHILLKMDNFSERPIVSKGVGN